MAKTPTHQTAGLPNKDNASPKNKEGVKNIFQSTKIDRDYFFKELRKTGLFTNLKQSQVDGLNFILDGCERFAVKSKHWIAYMLATAYHETARTMMPIAEYGKGRGRAYGSKIKMSRKGYTTPNQLYYGRGYVQLTWYENYEIMGKLLGIDLLNHPDKAMEGATAFEIMYLGMRDGLFTGKKLSNYLTDSFNDYRGARKIINGTDKAISIANYAVNFESCIKLV